MSDPNQSLTYPGSVDGSSAGGPGGNPGSPNGGGDGSPDPLRIYADLYQQAMECRRRVDLIRSIVSRAAEALDKRPERFRFDGIEGITMPRAVSEPFAPAAAWPTAEQVQQVFAEWHAAGARLSTAWDALWPRDRELLARSMPESANVPKTGLSEAVRRGRTLHKQSS